LNVWLRLVAFNDGETFGGVVDLVAFGGLVAFDGRVAFGGLVAFGHLAAFGGVLVRLVVWANDALSQLVTAESRSSAESSAPCSLIAA